MTVTACTLAALLSFEAASAPAASGACELTDDRCKAALYERRSVTAATADHRAQYLFNAHNLYLRLFDKTGDPRDLCAARRAIEASLAVEHQPETLRSESEALRAKLLARAKQQGTRCASKTKRVTPAEAPLLARGPATKPAAPTSKQEPPDAGAAASATEPSASPDVSAANSPVTTSSVATTPASAPTRKPALLADADAGISERPADVALMPVTSRQDQAPPASTPHPGRGLVITGGVTLGVGAALAVGAGVVSRRMSDTREEITALNGRVDRYATDAQLARDAELRGDYQAQQQQRLALALGSSATIVVAMILTGVGGRRLARAASRTAFIPAPAGLVFRLRF